MAILPITRRPSQDEAVGKSGTDDVEAIVTSTRPRRPGVIKPLRGDLGAGGSWPMVGPVWTTTGGTPRSLIEASG